MHRLIKILVAFCPFVVLGSTPALANCSWDAYLLGMKLGDQLCEDAKNGVPFIKNYCDTAECMARTCSHGGTWDLSDSFACRNGFDGDIAGCSGQTKVQMGQIGNWVPWDQATATVVKSCGL